MIERLLKLLAEREGDDLDVVGLTIALRPTQAQVVSAIAQLLGEGRIDGKTLRPLVLPAGEPIQTEIVEERRFPPEEIASVAAPPRPPRGFKLGDGEASAPLFAALKAEADRRGLSLKEVSVAVWGNKARIYQLSYSATARAATAEKIRAWIAAAPPPLDGAPIPANRGAPVTVVPPGPGLEPSPIELLREIEAFRERSGWSESKFGVNVNGDASLVKAIRAGRQPQRKTVAKIRALIADWRADPAQVERAPSSPARRDPTQPPETPDMDAAERQRANGQRHFAKARREQESVAASRLDAGKPPRNSFERTAMTHIEQRRADEARAVDPVEQARVALQRKGRSVYAADVAGGLPGHFHISGIRDGNGRLKDVTPAALIAEAERITGQSFRRAAS